MAFALVKKILPAWQNAALALVAAGLLILAFPDFEFWFLAWFALVPLMWAVERQKDSVAACFTIGWIFGTAFFFGTCWWLTYAPIHYAAFPWPLAYFLILVVALAVGIFPALFTAILAVLIRRFGSWAFLAAPFVWVFTEFLRYWLTGNNWNAIGYSQAFVHFIPLYARVGGVLAVSFTCVLVSSGIMCVVLRRDRRSVVLLVMMAVGLPCVLGLLLVTGKNPVRDSGGDYQMSDVIALQPNVPMSGMDFVKFGESRDQQISMVEAEIKKLRTEDRNFPALVIFPESPMNFMYNDDREFQQFIGDFARRNNVSILFNSAEPDPSNGKYFNSAVMVGTDGKEMAQYDKIHLLPFGEAVPRFLEGIVPGFVGNFSYGSEYDLVTLGNPDPNIMSAKAGVMICFESHFGQLSREYVSRGADVIIEMTNDGYLGPTPVLRQHLANAVFRAVETNRPVIRVTNVGITARIAHTGQVCDSYNCTPDPYTQATRVWSVSKSDGSQTFYVKYGDWFAWLCTVITFVLVAVSIRKRQTA